MRTCAPPSIGCWSEPIWRRTSSRPRKPFACVPLLYWFWLVRGYLRVGKISEVLQFVTFAVTLSGRTYGKMRARKAEPHAQTVLTKAATRSIYEPATEPNNHRGTFRRMQRIGDAPAWTPARPRAGRVGRDYPG